VSEAVQNTPKKPKKVRKLILLSKAANDKLKHKAGELGMPESQLVELLIHMCIDKIKVGME